MNNWMNKSAWMNEWKNNWVNVGGQCAGLWRYWPDITAALSPPPSQTFLLSGEFPRLDSRTNRILIPLSSLKNITHLEQCDNSWLHSRSSNFLALLDFKFSGEGQWWRQMWGRVDSEAGNWNVWCFFCGTKQLLSRRQVYDAWSAGGYTSPKTGGSSTHLPKICP